jgi:NTE family protein
MISHLVLCSGSVKGYAILGTLNHLYLLDRLTNVNSYTGCSIGGIIASLLSIGYTPAELYGMNFLPKCNIGALKKIYNLFYNYGLMDTDIISSTISQLFINKGFKRDITFKEHFEQSKKYLCMNGSCVTDFKSYFFNVYSTPDMKVIDAIKVTMCIPLVFIPSKIGCNFFVDGSLTITYPFYYKEICKQLGKYHQTYEDLEKAIYSRRDILDEIDYENTFGIYLDDTDAFRPINNIGGYATNVILTMSNKLDKMTLVNPINNRSCIALDNSIIIKINWVIDTTKFDISLEDRKRLYDLGFYEALKYIKRNSI